MINLKRPFLLGLLLSLCHFCSAQFLMDFLDTTTEMGRSMLSLYHKYDNITISGYMQPQFQVAQKDGAASYIGGDFPERVNNRFMLRRGRVRFDYIHFAQEGIPSVQFVFQFDGTERGVNIRDFWGRVFENRLKVFSLTAGMFARPFSYELNLSSSDRESPERGRMSQILTKTERDMGVMVTFSPREKHPLQYIQWDLGVFNGQGMTAPMDYDSYKDVITRIYHKPRKVWRNLHLSGGLSYLHGGIEQQTPYTFTTREQNGLKQYVVDSSESNLGKIAPRRYAGADVQLKWQRNKSATELRAEYVFGKQTATRYASETPPEMLTGDEGYYKREFDGAYFYVLHQLKNPKHQFGLKLDWYDPNTAVEAREIGDGNNLNEADIEFTTIGGGYIFHASPNLRITAWYDHVKNESTSIAGFTSDVKDDVFTLRMQFRF